MLPYVYKNIQSRDNVYNKRLFQCHDLISE